MCGFGWGGCCVFVLVLVFFSPKACGKWRALIQLNLDAIFV